MSHTRMESQSLNPANRVPLTAKSSEEEHILQIGNKKLKNAIVEDVNNNPTANRIPSMLVGKQRQPISYKDSLVGITPDAYEKVFFEDFNMDQDHPSEMDTADDEPLEDRELKVELSKEAKIKIRQKWLSSLIIKVFGKNIGYSYLKWKIQDL